MTAFDTTNNNCNKADEKAVQCGGDAGEKAAPFELEAALSELGSFGRYQLLLLLLLAYRDFFLAMCNYNYVFTAADTNFRCVIPECESEDNIVYNASFVQYALPNLTNTCFRLASVYGSGGDGAVLSGQWSENATCGPHSFVPGLLVPCERRVYENYNSIVAEFDLGCEPWKRTLVGSAHNMGLLISCLLSGIISDRFGRKSVIVISPLCACVFGLGKAAARDYWTLLTLEFLEAALGYGNASIVLCLEAAGSAHRVVFVCLCEMASLAGGAALAGAARLAEGGAGEGAWRRLVLLLYAPLAATVLYCCLLDEGVRWLLSRGRGAEAARVLQRAARVNRVAYSPRVSNALDALADTNRKQYEANLSVGGGGGGGGGDEKAAAAAWRAALRSSRLRARVCLLAAGSLLAVFGNTGAVLAAADLTGDKYLNFSMLWIMVLPVRIVLTVVLTHCGRRVPILVVFLLCAMCFLGSAAVPSGAARWQLALHLCGAALAAGGVFALWLQGAELLPTAARHALLNVAAATARLGAALAPQATLLRRFGGGMPSLVFGVTSLLTAGICLLLPDTSRRPLPDDVTEAERLDDAPPPPSPPPPPLAITTHLGRNDSKCEVYVVKL